MVEEETLDGGPKSEWKEELGEGEGEGEGEWVSRRPRYDKTTQLY